MLRGYRNKETHRYLLGIDELTVFTHKRRLSKKEKKLYRAKGDYTYTFEGKPKLKFSRLILIIKKIIYSLDLAIFKLLELDIMNNVSVVREEK